MTDKDRLKIAINALEKIRKVFYEPKDYVPMLIAEHALKKIVRKKP